MSREKQPFSIRPELPKLPPGTDVADLLKKNLVKLREKYGIGKKKPDQTDSHTSDTTSVFEKLRMMPVLMKEFEAKHGNEYSRYSTNQSRVESGTGSCNDPFIINLFFPGEARKFMRDFNTYIAALGYTKGVYFQRMKKDVHARHYFVTEDNEIEILPSSEEALDKRASVGQQLRMLQSRISTQ